MYSLTDSIFCDVAVPATANLAKVLADKNIKMVVILDGGHDKDDVNMADQFTNWGFEIEHAPEVRFVEEYSTKKMSKVLNQVVFNSVMGPQGNILIWRYRKDGVLTNFLYDILRFLSLSDEVARDILGNALGMYHNELSEIDSCIR